jgi:hypothetical protein
MWKLIRTMFLASLLLFGAAASTSLYAAEAEYEEIDDGTCAGEVEPICRTRERKTCVEWSPCNLFTRCCTRWKTTTVNDYFRDNYVM